jgi:hypothetical protein
LDTVRRQLSRSTTGSVPQSAVASNSCAAATLRMARSLGRPPADASCALANNLRAQEGPAVLRWCDGTTVAIIYAGRKSECKAGLSSYQRRGDVRPGRSYVRHVNCKEHGPCRCQWRAPWQGQGRADHSGEPEKRKR